MNQWRAIAFAQSVSAGGNMPISRRNCLKQLAAVGATGILLSNAPAAARSGLARPIQLHVELDVTPGKEKEMEEAFQNLFSPLIRKQPGFVEVKLLKFTKAFEGKEIAPYRLLISFETDEQRLRWVANPEHQHVWPTIGKTLRYEPNTVILYETV
jgi:heme-degrading monooxygenase HmoA